MILLLALLMIGGVATYDMNDWQYVGYHKCKQIGVVDPGKARVYPLSVEDNHYILFKQKNNDNTYTVTCTKDKPRSE